MRFATKDSHMVTLCSICISIVITKTSFPKKFKLFKNELKRNVTLTANAAAI